MANQITTNLIYYIKATDLPIRAGMPTGGYFIYSDGDLIRRVSTNELVSNIINATFEVIKPDTVVPSTGYWRFRVLEPATFSNVNPTITVSQSEIDKNWVYIVVNNGVAKKELEAKPDESSQLKNWVGTETLRFPHMRLHGGAIYRVKAGQTAGVNDVPGVSGKWEKIVVNTITLESAVLNLIDEVGDLGNLNTDNSTSIVGAINEVLSKITQGGTPSLNEVALVDNRIDVPIVGSSYFQSKGNNDFAQMRDIGLYIFGLRVIKKPDNLDDTKIQKHDYAEGWITNNIFVSGFFKGTDSTQSQISNENNWNGITKF